MGDLSIKEILMDIDARISHMEDMTADNRAIIVKLVKQNNQIVEFLKQIEIDEIIDDFDDVPRFPTEEIKRSNKMESLKELIDEYMERHDDLKELEEELKKHKSQLTPGQVGES
jgi:DNA repair ATPase RecN